MPEHDFKNGIVYIDGTYYQPQYAKISVFDHAVLYGDGVYDTIRVYNGKAFRLKDHLKRLGESAQKMSIYLPKNLKNIIKETYRKSQMKDAFIRIIITRGIGPMGVNPKDCKSSVIIMVVKRPENNKPVKVITFPFSRNFADIKSLNYMTSVMAKIYALKKGFDDAILMMTLVGGAENITEATTDNVFIVKNKIIYTPRGGILEGITKEVIMNKFKIYKDFIRLKRILETDEIFLAGTGAGIIPVIQVNDRKLKVGPITKKIMKWYEKEKLKGELL